MWEYKHTDELYHYGVPGMKWGVRRQSGSRSKGGSKNKNGINKQRSNTSTLKKYQKLTEASSKLSNELRNVNNNSMRSSAKRRKKLDLSSMSDNDLRSKINRAILEKQYNDIYNPKVVSKGRRVATSILEGVGTALTITGSALGIAVAVKELRGK